MSSNEKVTEEREKTYLKHKLSTIEMECDLLKQEVARLHKQRSIEDTSLYNTSDTINDDNTSLKELLDNLKDSSNCEKLQIECENLYSYLRKKVKNRIDKNKYEKNKILVEKQDLKFTYEHKSAIDRDKINLLSKENGDMKEEVDNLKLVYSLKKGMSSENEIKTDYDKKMNEIEIILLERNAKIQDLYEENQKLLNSGESFATKNQTLIQKYNTLANKYNELISKPTYSKTNQGYTFSSVSLSSK